MKSIIDKPFLLEPAFKYYDWGSLEFLQNLTGRSNLKGKTAAEMWMGDHISGPNMIKYGKEIYPLHNLVEEEAVKLIGEKASSEFSGKIPFLFKVLAAAKPLSIQSHPSKKQAEEGFERENILDIALDDFTRGYKDNNHKPEIIYALTDFKMMKGFRNYETTAANFKKYCPDSSVFLFEGLKEYSEEKKIKKLFTGILTSCKSDCVKMINEALKKTENDISLESEMINKFSQFYPGDSGILSPLYLNCAMIKKGEAVYIPAGELHAYVEGCGMELMANSDNVFRGGLTPKHIDRDELLKILKYKPTEINKVEKTVINNEIFYKTESNEFLFSEISVNKDEKYISDKDRNIDILICYEGNAEVESKDGAIIVKKGDSFAVPSCAGNYSITGKGIFYKATVPI